ncbi:thioredoxin domain-containing protein [Martelella sp. HB161492]|uniref:DsbA family protein n=1 Tax=Martelella sp. HB161492 TaxID=2720726 RepID=UPI001592121F|nr:thioredoxin domain-containing protein [Martelella sp. HB161492]
MITIHGSFCDFSKYRFPAILTALGLMVLASQAIAGDADLSAAAGRADRPEGSSTAAVTLVEYSSPTCSHCVAYRTTVAPRINEAFVQTGKIRYLFRPFVRNNVDMAIFMLAEGQSAENYDQFVASFYAHYDDLINAQDLNQTLRSIAAENGISDAEFDRLVTNEDAFQALRSLTDQAVDDFDVQGTPSFFINGAKIVGGIPYDEMKAHLDDAIAKANAAD